MSLVTDSAVALLPLTKPEGISSRMKLLPHCRLALIELLIFQPKSLYSSLYVTFLSVTFAVNVSLMEKQLVNKTRIHLPRIFSPGNEADSELLRCLPCSHED
jgi:hypothetical protein